MHITGNKTPGELIYHKKNYIQENVFIDDSHPVWPIVTYSKSAILGLLSHKADKQPDDVMNGHIAVLSDVDGNISNSFLFLSDFNWNILNFGVF